MECLSWTKPYVIEFDVRAVDKIGWLEENVNKLSTSKDDERFQKQLINPNFIYVRHLYEINP